MQPVVVAERGGDQRERNLELGTSWFQRRDDWPAIPADDGPDEWQRVSVEIDLDVRVGEPGERSRNVDYVLPTETIEAVALPAVTVTDVEIRQQSISLRRRPDRRAGARSGELLPELAGRRRRGALPRLAQPHGGRPDGDDVTLTYGESSLDWFFYA